jgi:sulfoxide reductase catalytic subunit YedY
VTVGGECEVKGTFTLEDLLAPHPARRAHLSIPVRGSLVDVIPWVGFPLKDLLARFKPNANAKYVAFKTIVRPSEMPASAAAILDWPYVEGLRIDEACTLSS